MQLCLQSTKQEHWGEVSKETPGLVLHFSGAPHPHPTTEPRGAGRSLTTSWSNQRGKGPGTDASSPYLALQLVSFLGTAEPQVFRQGSVLGERVSIVLVAGQALSLLGMHQGHHVQRQMELRL